MRRKLTEYIVSKYSLDFEECQYSTYITLSDTKQIRISNHISTNNAGKYLNILITADNQFVVAFKNNVLVYKTLIRVKQYIDYFMLFYKEFEHELSIAIGSANGWRKQLEEATKQLGEIKRGDITELQTKLNLQIKENRLLMEAAEKRNKKLKQLQEELKEKDADIKEAVDLLTTLQDSEVRDYLKNRNTGKIYYLDNFPDEYADIIKELIKQYK